MTQEAPGRVVRLTRKYSSGPWTLPPRGAFCTHRRMRAVSCGSTLCPKPCRVECPDCELYWLFEEGLFYR